MTLSLGCISSAIHFRRFARASLLTLALLLGLEAAAAPGDSGVTYQGRILKPSGEPLNGTTTQFRMQIRAPDDSGCLMYEETRTLNMATSGGSFSMTMNDGTGIRTDTSGYNFNRVLANAEGTANEFTFAASACAPGYTTYAPQPGDGRILVVDFKDETMATWERIPAQKINYVPFAFEAKRIAGFSPTSLLRIAESDGTLGNVSPLSNAMYTELLALIGGTSTQYQLAGTIATGSVVGASLANNITIATTGSVTTDTASTKDFRLTDPDASTTNYVKFQANPGITANYTYTWPINYGSTRQVLTTDGAGNLTWTPSTQWIDGSAGAIGYTSGNVGIGTTTPVSTLNVNGAIVSNIQLNAAPATNINFANGNVHISRNATTDAAFNLCGLKDGGQYTLILKAQPNGSIPTFTAYSDALCTLQIPNFDSGGVRFLVSGPTVILSFVRGEDTVYAMFAAGFTH